jgi:hypothetical protein
VCGGVVEEVPGGDTAVVTLVVDVGDASDDVLGSDGLVLFDAGLLIGEVHAASVVSSATVSAPRIRRNRRQPSSWLAAAAHGTVKMR